LALKGRPREFLQRFWELKFQEKEFGKRGREPKNSPKMGPGGREPPLVGCTLMGRKNLAGREGGRGNHTGGIKRPLVNTLFVGAPHKGGGGGQRKTVGATTKQGA